jgi:rieske iron-sulfur protein
MTQSKKPAGSEPSGSQKGASIDRRTIVVGGVCAGLTLGLTPVSLAAQEDPATVRPKAGDALVRIEDETLKPLRPEDIQAGMPQVLAWPMDPAGKIVRRGSRLNRVMLLRLDESQLVGETKNRTAGGVVAYTAICTHTGCDVTDWLPDPGFLYCPCHFTKYDPKDGARVVDGPAPRPLPALPLRIEDGQLVVAGPFSARVTFEPA